MFIYVFYIHYTLVALVGGKMLFLALLSFPKRLWKIDFKNHCDHNKTIFDELEKEI
jgi:hypothetical protein